MVQGWRSLGQAIRPAAALASLGGAGLNSATPGAEGDGEGMLMAGLVMVAIAAVAFVGTHIALSHPLRAPIVARVGEGGFAGIYSLVAAATLGWLVAAYLTAPAAAPLWPAGDGLWALVSLVMLIASILLMGSLVRNPALPAGARPGVLPDTARGVMRSPATR